MQPRKSMCYYDTLTAGVDHAYHEAAPTRQHELAHTVVQESIRLEVY